MGSVKVFSNLQGMYHTIFAMHSWSICYVHQENLGLERKILMHGVPELCYSGVNNSKIMSV